MISPGRTLLILTAACCFSAAFGADPAQDETYFFKISKSLRGMPPSLEERNAFAEAARLGTVPAFLQGKTQQYLKEEAFTYKLKQQVDELVRVQEQRDFSRPLGKSGTSYDRLVTGILQGNLSWDQLLLAKSYRYGDLDMNNFFFGLKEDEFFAIPFNGQVPTPGFGDIEKAYDPTVEHRVDFPAGDSRIAGILTTPRFFGRYVNTALNKNRRRAAAVFRIFLCDTMAPSVPARDDKGDDQDFDTIFPGHKAFSEDDIRRNAQGDIHGSLPDCKACHYKLDPLGQTFGFSAATLAPMASPGALRFQGADGRKVDTALGGLGDLGAAITQQPEYARCQVRHFWNWYVGKDVPMSRHQEDLLVQRFDVLGRKPQDFVAYLVGLPEFRAKPVALNEDQLLARRAVKILKNCNDCHQSQSEDLDMRAWDLTDLPFPGTAGDREDSVQMLRKALDLANEGANKKMPPKDSLWKLGQEDFNLLKNWIAHGAPDFNGQPQVAPQENR
jgi:hypothetical protein